MSDHKLIAIIDDDSAFRDAVEGLIRSMGHRVIAHASADEFLAHNPNVDCVVTDIQMPGTSGIELALKLKTRGDRVPVIIVTARSDSSLVAKARASGAYCVLRKPFKPQDFIQCLDGAIG